MKEETIDEASFTVSGETGMMHLKADTPDERSAWVDFINKEISMIIVKL